MTYSIDYPDHELAKFIGQIFICRHELHLVFCASVTGVKKYYNDEGKPYQLTIYLSNGSQYDIEEQSSMLNNPDYTINGATIGVKPDETQQAIRTSYLKRAPKKIHKASPCHHNCNVHHHYKVSYESSSWDSDIVTDQTREDLTVVAKDYEDALAIALRRLDVYLGNMVRYYGENETGDLGNGTFKASWFSEDAFEGGGSDIHVTIERVK